MKNIIISLANFCLSSCGGKTWVPVMFKSFLLTLNRCFLIVAIFCYESTIIDPPSLIHKKSHMVPFFLFLLKTARSE